MKKNYLVTVEKNGEQEKMEAKAVNKEIAMKYVVDTFYYDGWHAVSAEEL